MAKSDIYTCDCKRSEEGISIWFKILVLQRQIHSICWELIGNRPCRIWYHTQRARTHWKLHSPGKKIMEQHLFLRGTLMFYLFMLSALVFNSSAFHHLQTRCLGRQAWRIPAFCSNPLSCCCIPCCSHYLTVLHPESKLCAVRFS